MSPTLLLSAEQIYEAIADYIVAHRLMAGVDRVTVQLRADECEIGQDRFYAIVRAPKPPEGAR